MPPPPPPRENANSAPITPTGKTVAGVPSDPTLTPLEKVKAFLKSIDGDGEFEGWASDLCRTNLIPISATLSPTPTPTPTPNSPTNPPPLATATFTFTITPPLTNRLGNLHGGCTATIADIVTTCALAPLSRPGYWQYAGVSHSLSVTYLRPAPMGTEVLVHAEVLSAGKGLAVMRATFVDRKSGKVVAVAEHGKASIEPKSRL